MNTTPNKIFCRKCPVESNNALWELHYHHLSYVNISNICLLSTSIIFADAVVASSILLIISSKTLYIQNMKIWLRQLNTMNYYRWTIGAATTLYYYIDVYVLGVSEET